MSPCLSGAIFVTLTCYALALVRAVIRMLRGPTGAVPGAGARLPLPQRAAGGVGTGDLLWQPYVLRSRLADGAVRFSRIGRAGQIPAAGAQAAWPCTPG